MGDVVYNDEPIFLAWRKPATPEMMREKYQKQKTSTSYRAFTQSTPVVGTWDDHDYGYNDGNKHYSEKKESQKEFLKFLDEDPESERWKREGVYGSVTVGPVGQQTKILLLDTRYFRDLDETGLKGGDILGERQWQWFRQELAGSKAQIHLVVSGTQVLPRDKPLVEKWATFPKSYGRMMDILSETRPPGVIFLSGDVHYAELMRKECVGVGYPVYEMTSSGMTHSCWDTLGLACQLVLDHLVNTELAIATFVDKNFGTMEIDWGEQPPKIHLQARNVSGHVVIETVFNAGVPSATREICPKEKEFPLWIVQPKAALFKKVLFSFLQTILCFGVLWVLLRFLRPPVDSVPTEKID